MFPEPESPPIVESFSGGEDYLIEGVSDHHMPFGYGELNCEIHELHAEMLSFQTMKLQISFTLTGPSDAIQNLYNKQGWKFQRTLNLIKKNRLIGEQLHVPAPLFGLMLNKYLQVVDVTARLEDKGPVPVLWDQSCDLTLLPDSFPPAVEMQGGQCYSYYNKKTTLIYGDIVLGRKYKFEIEFEANAGTFEFAPLFPCKNVVFEKVSFKSSEYKITPMAIVVTPTRSDRFPDWYEDSLEHKRTFEPRLPNFQPAQPFRGTMPLFDVEAELAAKNPKTPEEAEKMLEDFIVDLDAPVELKDYATLRFGILIVIPIDKNIEVNVRSIQRPLPPRIYDQMQKLPGYQDVLVRYDIFNFDKKKKRLRVETEILGYTEKESRVTYVHGMGKEGDQKTRIALFQCPVLKRDVLDGLHAPQRAMMRCKVIDEGTKETLFEETREVNLLANDEILWELKDVRSNAKYKLHDFICAWITPRDSSGSIEQLRTEAAKLRASGSFGDFSDATPTLGDIESHARAVYELLTVRGMRYVNQPFSSHPQHNSQRVVLPEIVLKNNAGNCIDLVVLFASILEGAGIYSLIMLTKDHAFIGWGDKRRRSRMIFLETTLIGKASFDEAKEYGKKAFEDNFLMQGLPDDAMPPLFLIAESKECYIIDTGEIRYSGRIAARKI